MTLEHEAKALINETEFINLMNKLNPNLKASQVNYYFETRDQYFKNNRSALRVRVIDKNYQLTLKINNGDHNIEHNFDIDYLIFDKMINQGQLPHEILTILNLNLVLFQVFVIETNRYVYPYQNHMIELDHSKFLNTIDFELEVEAESLSIANDILNAFCNEHNLNPLPSRAKIARYFEYNK
jgi:uncharacterized protein YjbK